VPSFFPPATFLSTARIVFFSPPFFFFPSHSGGRRRISVRRTPAFLRLFREKPVLLPSPSFLFVKKKKSLAIPGRRDFPVSPSHRRAAKKHSALPPPLGSGSRGLFHLMLVRSSFPPPFPFFFERLNGKSTRRWQILCSQARDFFSPFFLLPPFYIRREEGDRDFLSPCFYA